MKNMHAMVLHQNIYVLENFGKWVKNCKNSKNFPPGNFVASMQYILFTALGWSLYCLAQNEEHQEKCRNEVRDILADRDSDEITWYLKVV